ncbi:uncharacterized protein FA14DRAFT_191721 [Meira miltonrushii]|uniref:BRCT domain-containing protein n=1 Tax=Meira miltonrushii TaxID=1280837 RepID=A0A316V5X0_9BASI|nr:uncharacterized protein FA14DRAFT_191721 [Meira miltonrushii]PWN32634.1 hypothetical protein FA14DRAFT_191721 [Meira miltonrushii]
MSSTVSRQREQRKLDFKKTEETISRLQRLQENRSSGKSSENHTRLATPQYDPENPFDDRSLNAHARELTLNEVRSSRKSPSTNNAVTKSITPREPIRTRSALTKSDLSPPSLSTTPQTAKSEKQSSDRPRLRRRQTTAEGEDNASKVEHIETQSRQDYRSRTSRAEQREKESSLSSPPKRSPQKVRRRTDIFSTPEVKEQPSRGHLSEETKQALATLEKTLQQLKSLSPETSRVGNDSPIGARSDCASKPLDSSSRRRLNRALSPSKERIESERNPRASSRQMETTAKPGSDMSEKPKPRSSFLARVEQARSSPQPEEQKEERKENTPLRAEAQTQTNPIRRRRSLYSYTPPKLVDKELQCNLGEYDHSGETSASSIKIGEESVDDLVRSHGTEEDGKVRQFLQGVRILVDVRDQDGEDASALWTEKLRNVGAKVYTKVPQVPRKSRSSSSNKVETEKVYAPAVDCIIYKNGKPATLHYHRSQVEAGREPVIVGVNWILHCLREGKRVDENDYLVEVGKQAIFSGRRTSMTPKRAPPSNDQVNQSSTSSQSQPPKLADMLARKKVIQNAPVRPSPLANKCWNLDASTSSTISTATTTITNFTMNSTTRSTYTPSR